jgi:hypothetical protein
VNVAVKHRTMRRATVSRCCGTTVGNMCSVGDWHTFQVKSDRTFQVKSDLTSRKLTQNEEEKLDLMVRPAERKVLGVSTTQSSYTQSS